MKRCRQPVEAPFLARRPVLTVDIQFNIILSVSLKTARDPTLLGCSSGVLRPVSHTSLVPRQGAAWLTTWGIGQKNGMALLSRWSRSRFRGAGPCAGGITNEEKKTLESKSLLFPATELAGRLPALNCLDFKMWPSGSV